MDAGQKFRFREEFLLKNLGEIFALWERRATLVDEAQEALKEVIEERKIDISAIAREDALEQHRVACAEEARDERDAKQSALLLKIIGFVFVPVFLLVLIFSSAPGQVMLSGIVAGISGTVLSLIVWGISKLTRKPKNVR